MKMRILAVLAVSAAPLAAQTPIPTDGRMFNVGNMMIGPSVGLGGLGLASFALGARAERGLWPIQDFGLGVGVLGIGVAVDWYHDSQTFFGGKIESTYIPIGVTGNYHIFLKDMPKIDPYLGAGLGYSYASTSCTGTGFNCTSSGSGIYFISVLGARYFLNDNLALNVEAGAGAALFNIGVQFKMGGTAKPRSGGGGRVN